MFRAIVLCCAFYFLSLSPLLTYAMTAEQKAMVHEHFEKVGLECFKDNVLKEDDIKNLRARKMADGENVPCFLACMFKSIGILDDNGMLEKDSVMEVAKKIFEDPEELKLIADYIHSCSHVNTETVSDGAKGCERAMKAYGCMIENGSQFGFDI